MTGMINRPYEPLVGFRSEKAAQVCAYFLARASGSLEKLKLIKLLFLVERESAGQLGRPMLDDEYYSLEHGPICSSALNGINGELDQKIWSKYLATSGRKVSLTPAATNDEKLDRISLSDVRILDAVWRKFGSMTASGIRKWSHDNCAEYTEVIKGRIPITARQMAEAVRYENPDEFETSVREYRSAEAAFSF
jgi:uncharacterized phage-associated protein